MPERDYGLAEIVQRSGTARAGLLRDLGAAQAQNRLALGAAQSRGYEDQGQRSALLAGSLAKIVGGTVDAYQDQQKIKIAQAAEARKAAADEAAAQRDMTRTQIAQQEAALHQHEASLKAQDAALGVFTNLGQHALDHPEAWPTVLSAVSALSPEIVKTYGLTPEFDPEKVKVAMQAGTDHKTQIEQDKLAIEQRKLLDAETGPTAVSDQLKNMIQFATVDKTPEGIAARAKVINSWVPVKGHEEAFNKAREMFNAAPQTQEALRALSLTPEQNLKAAADAASDAETKRHNRAMENKPTGEGSLVQISGPNGQPIWVKKEDAIGKPSAQPARGVTGIERQSLAFFNRAKEADEIANKLDPVIAKAGIMAQGRLQYAPNWAQSPENQSYRQAQRAFTEARLRKESGAAIPEQEYQNDARTYFAQPGDGPEVIAQKLKGRQAVLQGLAFSSGKAYEEFYGEPLALPGRNIETPVKMNVKVDEAVPSNVAAALKDEKPGKHTLSDGSVWIKAADGTVSKGGG